MVADAPWQTVWLRRVASGHWFRRRRYEVEIVLDAGERRRHVTRAPVTAIDQHLGVGDAWALVGAADAKWNGRVGEWVTLAPDPSLEPPAP